MVIHAIQEDDAHGGLLERPRRRQAAESSPHDDDVRLCPLRLGFECFVHYASPVSLSPDRRAPRDPPGVGQPRPLRSRRKITFPNLRYGCTILGERVPCFAWEYLGAVVRYRFPMGIDTRPF